MTLPSERLKKRIRPSRVIALGAAALVVLGGLGVGAAAAAPLLNPAPTTTSVLVPAGPSGQVNAAPVVTSEQQEQANQQEAQLEADNAAKVKAAADAAAQQAAQQAAAEQAARDAASKKAPSRAADQPEPSSGLPSGATVPQPNGYPDTTLCASGSASTVNGVPTCD